MKTLSLHSFLLVVLILACCFFSTSGFFPGASRFGNGLSTQHSSTVLSASTTSAGGSSRRVSAFNPDRNIIDSKLLPPVSEDEFNEILKEYNITNYDINRDPEMLKWAPSKEFFERFGFANQTERYGRTLMDVKSDFYSTYTTPILPQYKTFIADLMNVLFTQRIDARYQYDALHAFGICTQYYTIMKGYAYQDEIDVIFNALMKSMKFDPVQIRDDAKRILSLIKETTASEEEFLNAQEGEFAKIFNNVRTNRFFKYTDSWGIGLGRLMELRGIEPNTESFERWSKSLKWVFTPRLMQSWSEFSSDQLKMQGIEAMQKQLLIREKKRAAERLERKAASFEDKKKALQELNEAIEERRKQLIETERELKKRYDPEGYERILREDAAVN